jgi:peptidoglycan/xylan/chitin deacetylase (PgdA/CDA1 family)
MLRRLRKSWRKNRHELKGLFNGSIPHFLFASRPSELGDGVPVFCYHTVTPRDMERDLGFLADNGYRTLSGDGLLAHLSGDVLAPPRSVVLTFDDGALNFFEVVLPLLRRYRMKAIAFVAPGMHFDRAPAGFENVSRRPMTWGELRELHSSGLVDVESHTYESRYVPEWPAPIPLDGVAPALEAHLRGAALPLREDLRLAKARLEEQLPGKVVKHLAFPAYDGTSAGIEAAQQCGYEACHWGLLPGRPVNRPGASALHVARLSHEYLRRLPGERRDTLVNVALGRARIVRSAWVRPST